MAQNEATERDILLGKKILAAASRHDTSALKILLGEGSANVRDPSTGTAPLHAAIEACGVNGEVSLEKEPAALDTVQLLFENGAIWNDLNNTNETPGCIAYRLGLKKVYDVMVDAGVRAEILLARMEMLGLAMESEPPSQAVETPEDASEGRQAKRRRIRSDSDDDVSKNNFSYLSSTLSFKPGVLLDESDNAVMMSWETQIMQRHAESLLPTPGLRFLNVGHGMGILDTAILDRGPSAHHIIEAHPQILKKLKDEGWYDKPNVIIHEGRWQDVLPKLVEQDTVLDAIYYDTFAEDYGALKEFFSEYVIQLLDENGRFGWFNGLGADRQICYDVYTKVAEIDLYEAGFDTHWEDIPVPQEVHDSKHWEGTRRPYWTVNTYRLPVNTFISASDY